jgi:hypothetical protein
VSSSQRPQDARHDTRLRSTHLPAQATKHKDKGEVVAGASPLRSPERLVSRMGSAQACGMR